MAGAAPDLGRGGLFALAPGHICDDVVKKLFDCVFMVQPLLTTISRVHRLGALASDAVLCRAAGGEQETEGSRQRSDREQEFSAR